MRATAMMIEADRGGVGGMAGTMTVIAVARVGLSCTLAGLAFLVWAGIGLMRLRRQHDKP